MRRRDGFLNFTRINNLWRGDMNFTYKNIYFMCTIFFLLVTVDLKIR